ncbi:hypothetical protein ASG39_18370 [Rhizobium sp. Leaf371]|uniref:TRAFAC clade GTPase domain-containing protein n=1 Tax=Rhizobium sp. Leaf371 TaxID=1736355 RepID=UPI000713CA13|nr:hypothetical protein [Rhizobium sp. Leaf371]KQS59295.1 hypothetical protein ASG39_18370 [Rhizobium sp. Leaf371]
MRKKSIILVGGPDSGKTNYVGRVWLSLKEHKSSLKRAGMPSDIEYIEAVCAHILKGEFAGRTDRNMERKDFCVPVQLGDGDITELVVPDFTGELWLNAVVNSELSQDWLDEIVNADSALLFVRVLSPQNVQPLDWVTAREVLRVTGNNDDDDDHKLPTQVVLCELLRLLEDRLGSQNPEVRPRIAVLVTAWDLLDPAAKGAGPMQFLKRQFPLFWGALGDVVRADVGVYGVSIVDGDPERDQAFKDKILASNLADAGSITLESSTGVEVNRDVTLPISWAIS